MKHLNVRIFGQVQGVGFRYYAKREADDLNLKGIIKNEKDGSVYIELEGEEDSIEDFLEWCNDGPELAKVDKIETEESPLKNYSEFLIQWVSF